MDASRIFISIHRGCSIQQIVLLISIIIAFLPQSSHCDRISEKIYTDVQSNHYCSRRLNATHQVGCTSKLGGNRGVVWFVESQQDLEHILKSGPTPPYVVITQREHYNRKNILSFKYNQERVAGVVLINDTDAKFDSRPFSPDDTCPNRYSGLYVNDSRYEGCKVNSWQHESPVSALLYDDIPFPIFFINETKSITDIRSCFEDNNLVKSSGDKRKQDTYPLCSMQLDSFMLAAGDTPTCINSHSLVDDLLQTNGRRCYTIDNQNVFAFYKPAYGPLQPVNGSNHLRSPEVVQSQSLILLIAKLSSLSMFTELSPGADSTITSIVTMLAIADALNKVRNSTEVASNSNNIAFAFLDSEPFDYTGSSRMVYSMQDGAFPNRYFESSNSTTNAMKNVDLKSVKYIINLDQIANYPQSDEMFVHTDPDNSNQDKLNRVLDVMNKIAGQESIKLRIEDPKLPLPPAPVHSFIKQSRSLADNEKPMGFVISNYGKKYTNQLYNSIYDDSRNVYHVSQEKLVEHLTRVGNLIAKAVYEIAFSDGKTNDISIDKHIIEELLDCYLVNAECNLFTKAWQAGQQLPAGPIQTYKDPIRQSDDMNGAITAHLLAYFVGDTLHHLNITDCYEQNKNSLIYNFQYVNGKGEPIKDGTSGVCVRSQMLMTPSTSPSYTVTEDSVLVNESYPAWTVSLNGIRTPARLFLAPSPTQEWCVFLMGLVVTSMSFIIVHQIRESVSRQQSVISVSLGTST